MPKDKTKGRTRGYSITINNYTKNDIKKFKDLVKDDYGIIGYEVGKEGTKHMQCFAYFKNKKSFSTIKEAIPRAHVEATNSTIASNITYCMKDEDYEEIGVRPRQGKRTDLDVIKFDIKKNVLEKEIANKYFSQWCQYRKAFREFKELNNEYDTVMVIYDAANTDSIRKAAEYIRKPNSLHMDDYFVDKQLFAYFSKKYEYVIVPHRPCIDDIIDIEDLQQVGAGVDIEKIKYITV